MKAGERTKILLAILFSGKNGSGKTTIWIEVCFALYLDNLIWGKSSLIKTRKLFGRAEKESLVSD